MLLINWIKNNLVFLASAIFSILLFKLVFEGYSFTSVSILSLLIILTLVLLVKFIRKPPKNSLEITIAVIIGLIAIQAGWPLFMPKISIENYDITYGIYLQSTNEKLLGQYAKIKVSPPLIPFFMQPEYPIAYNLYTVEEREKTPVMDIIKASDRNIKIKLNSITGWEWNEISERIYYMSYQPFDVDISHVDVDDVYAYKNLDHQFSEAFPYDYRFYISIRNMNKFPLKIRDLTLYIENNTSAWNKLKDWVDSDYCLGVFYSEDMDYTKNGYAYARIGKENSPRITREMFRNSNITILIPAVDLQPMEEKNGKSIVFQKYLCGSQPTVPHPIDGTIRINNDAAKNKTVKLMNINTTDESVTTTNSYGQYLFELANLPNKYSIGDLVKISVCETNDYCFEERTIEVSNEAGSDVDFNIYPFNIYNSMFSILILILILLLIKKIVIKKNIVTKPQT